MKGYTLIELVTAMAIFSIVGLMLVAGVGRTFRITAAMENSFEQTSMIEALLDRMELELTSAFYRTDSQWTQFKSTVTSESITLTFTALSGVDGVKPTGFEYEACGNSGEVISLYWSVTPNADSRLGLSRRFLWMDNLQEFKFSFFTKTEWIDTWDAKERKTLPPAVKVQLTDETGARFSRIVLIPSGRTWPSL